MGIADRVGECKPNARGFSDPVFLHDLDPFRPAKPGEILEQFMGILRDAQVVHGDLAFFHDGTAAPTAAVHHLFIGQYGLINRIPVDGAGLEIRNPLFAHFQKEPLVPFVILG